jgi:hypothetical protein
MILKLIAAVGCMIIFNNPALNFFTSSRVIGTRQEALEIGEHVMHLKWPCVNYDRYVVQVYFDNNTDEWHVFCVPKGEDGLPNYRIKGGGGPSLNLRKSDGKITESTFAQR